MCALVQVHAYMLQHAYRSQGTTCQNWLFPYTMYVLGIELGFWPNTFLLLGIRSFTVCALWMVLDRYLFLCICQVVDWPSILKMESLRERHSEETILYTKE